MPAAERDGRLRAGCGRHPPNVSGRNLAAAEDPELLEDSPRARGPRS